MAMVVIGEKMARQIDNWPAGNCDFDGLDNVLATSGVSVQVKHEISEITVVTVVPPEKMEDRIEGIASEIASAGPGIMCVA